MARHTLTIEEIEEYLDKEYWSQLACSFGIDSNKRLEANTKGIFRVTTHGKVTYQGKYLAPAVDAYNEAP